MEMQILSALFYKIPRALLLEGSRGVAVMLVTMFIVVPVGSLYWMFAVDAYRRLRYAVSNCESSGTAAFVISVLGASFAMGMISYAMSGSGILPEGGYSRTRGGGGAALMFMAYFIPTMALVLFFSVGMYLGGGENPSIVEWFDRWRHAGRQSRKSPPKRSTWRLWFHVVFWTPAAAMGACAVGMAAAALLLGGIGILLGAISLFTGN